MNVIGPLPARLILNAFVVIVGFLILSGAVNTAIVGSNGVLNRVAEDGVLPDWFLKPHRRFGTTSRLINLVVILQIFTIVVSRGNVLTAGRGLRLRRRLELRLQGDCRCWCCASRSRSIASTRCRSTFRMGRFDMPVGITLIFLVLAVAAIANLCTKEVATITGRSSRRLLFAIFVATEWYYGRGEHVDHMEQFNEETADRFTPEALGK